MTGKFKMANDERGWREAAVKGAQAAKLQSRSGGTSLQRNIKPERFRGGSAYANGTCALPPGAVGDDLEAVSNDFQSIPITFEKMMNPGGVRYMNCDLRAAGAGDGRGSFVRVGAVRLVSSEVSGCREAGGGFGDAGCSRKRRRRSRFAAAVQDTLVAAGDWGRFRGAPRLAGRPAANAIMLDELRLFPMISNQFQSLLKK